MIYELKYTREYKKQFEKIKSFKKDILKIHSNLTLKPFSGRTKKVKYKNLSNYFVTSTSKVKVFWKAQKGGVIVLVGVVEN